MNMVINTTHCKWYRTFFSDNATNILKHSWQILIAHDDTGTFRVKNDVRVQLGVSIGHNVCKSTTFSDLHCIFL